MTIFCRNYILLVYQRDVCTLQNHLGPTPTICNYHQPSTTSPTHLQSAKATSLNYLQPPLINPNQPQSTLISLHNPNHLQPLSINSSQSFSHENHCKCYKKLTSRSWPMLFTLAYFFFFFYIHSSASKIKGCYECCFPQQLWPQALFNYTYYKTILVWGLVSI